MGVQSGKQGGKVSKALTVDFFIVGLPKSGTSALAQFLDEHPEVCMSRPKEPGYFAADLITESDEFHGRPVYMRARTESEYRNMYRHCHSEKLLGDATPVYLYSKEAAKTIYKHNPQSKIIILLRHPVEFMQAMHMQYINTGTEDTYDFSEAMQKEAERKQGREISKYAVCPSLHYYRERAEYTPQVKRFADLFDPENILILTHEEFKEDNAQTYETVLDFLDLSKSHQPNFENVNPSQRPRSYKLHRILNNVRFKSMLRRFLGPQFYTRIKNAVAQVVMKPKRRQPISQNLYQELKVETKPDVERLSKLIDRDMLHLWGYDK